MTGLSPEADAGLRELLKRCSTATLAAAREFRRTGDTEQLPVIVRGIIERCAPSEMQERLKKSGDGLRLVQDLGIDSLAMMEMVLLLEEVLEISINIEELRPVRTLGDVTRFIEHKVGAGLLLGRRMF